MLTVTSDTFIEARSRRAVTVWPTLAFALNALAWYADQVRTWS